MSWKNDEVGVYNGISKWSRVKRTKRQPVPMLTAKRTKTNVNLSHCSVNSFGDFFAPPSRWQYNEVSNNRLQSNFSFQCIRNRKCNKFKMLPDRPLLQGFSVFVIFTFTYKCRLTRFLVCLFAIQQNAIPTTNLYQSYSSEPHWMLKLFD